MRHVNSPINMNVKRSDSAFKETHFTSHCRNMIKDIDSIMHTLQVRSTSQKFAETKTNHLSEEFKNALGILSTRVGEKKNSPSCIISRPVLLEHSSLGPGTYYSNRVVTPSPSPNPYLPSNC